MALTATIYRLQVDLSDVDRGVYESLDLRLAMHPSESLRYMVTRAIAYCLSYEPGIAFSKGGLSATDEPPVMILDPTGTRTAWIDIGAPSAERLHRASKSTPRVLLYSTTDVSQLRREAATRVIYRVGEIAVWSLEQDFVDALGAALGRTTKLDLTRTEQTLYVSVDGKAPIEGRVIETSLVA